MRRFFKAFFYLILISIVCLSLGGLVLWKAEGLRLYSVQTDSMVPALQPGDLAISVKPARLQSGDIISYRSSNNSSQIISHRLIKTFLRKGYVIAKGDNLNYPDPAVPYSSITGKTIKVIPKMGYAINTLRSPAGLIGLVYLPALALAAYELSRLAGHINYRPYGQSG